MYVKVICYLYPGVNLTGVAIVRVENGAVKAVAVGSVENHLVSPLLDLVRPTEMVVSTDKFYSEKHTRVPMPESVKVFRIAKPGWDKVRIPLSIEGKKQHGVYVHNVYKLMFRDIISRDVVLSNWNVEWFDAEWAKRHTTKELRRGR